MPGVFLFSLFPLIELFYFLFILFFLEIIGLLSDEFVILSIGFFLYEIDIIFATELSIELASKVDRIGIYLNFYFF